MYIVYMMYPEISEEQLLSEVKNTAAIDILPNLLNVVCRTTGVRFAAVARVTETRWITCLSHDEINFGLTTGDELKVETTLCHEVRQMNEEVIIDDVDQDPVYCTHHTPAMYGLKSYISVPIYKKDGSFFGTLCAIDSKPAKLNRKEVKDMFKLFAELISFHFQLTQQVDDAHNHLLHEKAERAVLLEKNNIELQSLNKELESFTYVASHDLQEPLRKIQTFSDKILNTEVNKLSESGKMYFNRLQVSVGKMQRLINDLLTYSRVNITEKDLVETDLSAIIEEIKLDYREQTNSMVIVMGEMNCAAVVPFQIQQLLRNLISNAVKFAKPGVDPVINISCVIERGDSSKHLQLDANKNYCHITVADNGIGFEQEYAEQVFKIFKRLHGNSEYDGTGIGLAIVKKIVDNHNGLITVQSKPNEGTQFDIYLPQ